MLISYDYIWSSPIEIINKNLEGRVLLINMEFPIVLMMHINGMFCE